MAARERRRTTATTISIALHGVLLAAAVLLADRVVSESSAPRSEQALVDIEVIAPQAQQARPEPADTERPGSPGTLVPAAAAAPEATASGASGRRGRAAIAHRHLPAPVDPRAELTITYDTGAPDANRPGSGTASDGYGRGDAAIGAGDGRGVVASLGLGTGGVFASAPAPVPRPPPAPPSLLARPPRAKREYRRWDFGSPPELGGSRILVELIIDTRGAVAGGRVLEGVNALIDQRALDVARRFEFYPALDDDGQPTIGRHRWQFVLEGDPRR